MSKSSLLERCQGPGAKDIRKLVQRAQRAADAVCCDYADYVLEKLKDVERIAARQNKTAESHDELLHAILDLRSSAAMANRDWIATFSLSLENSLRSRGIFDSARATIVALHLDAIKIAAQDKSSPEQFRHLEMELGRALAALG